MKRGSQWLTKGAEQLALREERDKKVPSFDVVIVGSGYGGAVAAARLAGLADPHDHDAARRTRKAMMVCVLERGLEYQPGDFPATFEQIVSHVRYSSGSKAELRGIPEGLFDFRLGDDVNALVANGFGGGSLINAGVAEPADAQTLEDMAWPSPWRGDRALWTGLYKRALDQLQAKRWSPTGDAKERAMRDVAERLGGRLRTVRLTIRRPRDGASAGDADTPPADACVRCGDCFSGCNHNAKLTLSHSYLARAWRRGAECYAGATVLRVERSGDGWHVRYTLTDPKRLGNTRSDKTFTVAAKRVILSAGSFGTTEILMRSSHRDLRFSAMLGQRFSTNADAIGAQCGVPEAVRPYADEHQAPDARAIGPTISHQIDLRAAAPADQRTHRFVAQGLTVPGPLGWVYGEVLTSLMLPQRWQRFDLRWHQRDTPDVCRVDDGPGGLLQRSMLVATIGHDGAQGCLQPLPGFKAAKHDGTIAVAWSQVGELDGFRFADQRMEFATQRDWQYARHAIRFIDGRLQPQQRQSVAYWLRNPLWQATPMSKLLKPPRHRAVATVHPLGGCPMAETMRDGAVDPLGQVFDAGSLSERGSPGARGGEWAGIEDRRVHPNLFVLDGSIVPTSLGINPLLTITALAEGIIDRWCESFGWQPASVALRDLPPRATKPAWQKPTTVPTALRFSERMHGIVAAKYALPQPLTANDPPRTEPLSAAQRDRLRWPRLSIEFEFGHRGAQQHPLHAVRAFLGAPGQPIPFKARIDLHYSYWQADRVREQDEPPSDTPLEATGTAIWFEQAPSSPLGRMLRAFWGWLTQRAAADLFVTPLREDEGAKRSALQRALPRVWPFIKALSHFGAPRMLIYRFDPLARDLSLRDATGAAQVVLRAGDRLGGRKTLVYERGANPWRQLTEMVLERQRADGSTEALTRLRFDPLHRLDRDTLPLTLLGQRDGISGLRDTAALALYFSRVVFASHFLSFREPDYAEPRPLRRLPTQGKAFAGCDWEVHAVRLRHHGETIWLRLTHIARKGTPRGDPVLLLHGFGSGGIQFTHESIPVPMAAYLATAGLDVWVGELRTSIGLPTCERQWVMDDIAKNDVPALVDHVRAATGREQIDVVAHCIGSAMFCMATLAGELAGHIRRAVLMQVGPVIHLPPENRVRGYIGNRAQQLMGAGKVESTVDDRAGNADLAFDRLLGTLTFLGGWNPAQWRRREQDGIPALACDRAHNGRRVNALRSAGVFGQLFQWKNMDDERLLDALPDLLGPCNLTTYQQTVYYAFARQLTNQAGMGAYVTYDNARKHFGFETLFIQGRLNDAFDERGTHDSTRLLQRAHAPLRTVERIVVEDYGHLDSVVGVKASEDVFAPLLEFLRLGFVGPARVPPQSLSFREPAIGPWIGDAWWHDAELTLSVGLKADDTLPPPDFAASVVVIGGVVQPHTLTFYPLAEGAQAPLSIGAAMGTVRAAWEDGEAVLDLALAADECKQAAAGLEVWVCTPDLPADIGWPTATDFIEQWQAARSSRPGAGRTGAATGADALVITAPWLEAHSRKGGPIAFVLGSCRQAPLLIDRELADAAFDRLRREHLTPQGGRVAISHLLLVGDQVYADALAATGQVEGTRARFFDVHREAWTAPNQRDVLRRVPTYMAADDHEFRDDYNNEVRAGRSDEFKAARAACWRYQYAAGPAGQAHYGSGKAEQTAPLWYAFVSAGYDFFVCDTRSERTDQATVDRGAARIMSRRQFAALRLWLRRTRSGASRARFIVMASPPFPFFACATGHEAHAVRADSWQRFPASLARLTQLICDDGTGNLVFLSGDYHCFTDSAIEISGGNGQRVPARCITTAGLFAPYGFANTDIDELCFDAADSIASGLAWRYRTSYARNGSGYVRIDACEGQVNARFTVVLPAGHDQEYGDPRAPGLARSLREGESDAAGKHTVPIAVEETLPG